MKTDRTPKCAPMTPPITGQHLPGVLQGLRIAQNFPEFAFGNTVSNDFYKETEYVQNNPDHRR